MRYISEVDNKVFNTEQECLEHENRIRIEREEESKRKEKLEIDRRNRLDEIYKMNEGLQKLIADYKKDYGDISKIYYHDPLVELLKNIF